MPPMNTMIVTDTTGAKMTINLDQVRTIRALPEGSQIMFSVDHTIIVRETPKAITATMEAATNERHSPTVHDRSRKTDEGEH